MKLAIPYTELFRKREEEFLQLVDAIELKHAHPDFMVPSGKTLLLHLGEGIIQDSFWNQLLEGDIFDFLRRNRIECFSFDFGPAAAEVVLEDYYYVARTDILDKAQILEIAEERINYIKGHFDGTIAVENLNRFHSDAYLHVCEPEFIKDFVEKNDISLVLDIGHAEISAHNLGMDISEYIKQLPLGRTMELHISKAGMVNGVMRDCHEKPDEATYHIVRHILDVCHPEYLVVEYYKDSEALLDTYHELQVYVEE